MRLYYSGTSPYSRKVRLVILEKDLGARIETLACNPFEEAAALQALNPLGKVPTLVTDEGLVLYDSPVICEYLDSLSAERPLIPSGGTARWTVLRWQALADGLLDAAYNTVMERRRPAAEQSPTWLQHWDADIRRGIEQIERELDSLPEALTLAQLALGAALAYLDFRRSDIEWRSAAPALAAWFKTFAARPAMQATRPE